MTPLTKSQAALLMVYTGTQLMKGVDFLPIIEKKLGRPVNKAEFGTPELIEQLREVYQDDWLELLDLQEDSRIQLLS